jgi:hypothetical protein
MRGGGVSARIWAVLFLKAASPKARVLKKGRPDHRQPRKPLRYDGHNTADDIDVSLMTTSRDADEAPCMGKAFCVVMRDGVTSVVASTGITYVVVVSARAHTRCRDTVNWEEQSGQRQDCWTDRRTAIAAVSGPDRMHG